METRIALAAAAASLAVLAACANTSDTEDGPRAADGRDYARSACAGCHAVESGDSASPNPAAPTFQSLADRPDMSRVALGALLRTPHRAMPDLIVSPSEADALYAYFETLRRSGA